MTLQVFTARISSRDPDRLDITRQACLAAWKRGERSPGEPFAPSWAILKPALAARMAREMVSGHPSEAIVRHLEERVREAWDAYEPAYRAEMHVSAGMPREKWTAAEEAAAARGASPNREAWKALLDRPRVVLVCFCVFKPDEPQRCHRRLLTGYLAAFGAVDRGEVQHG